MLPAGCRLLRHVACQLPRPPHPLPPPWPLHARAAIFQMFLRLVQVFHMAPSTVSYGSIHCFVPSSRCQGRVWTHTVGKISSGLPAAVTSRSPTAGDCSSHNLVRAIITNMRADLQRIWDHMQRLPRGSALQVNLRCKALWLCVDYSLSCW